MSDEPQLIMTPGPTNVPPRVMRAMLRPTINHRGPEFRALYSRILENLKFVFQTRNDVFPLSCSGTGGVECAIANLLSGKEKIAVTVNGVFGSRLKEAIAVFGGEPVEIAGEWNSAPTPESVSENLRKTGPVKAVAVVYNETSTGVTARQLREIGDVVRRHGALFVVDAISILGGAALPVDKWEVDVCITGSQKCLMCPPGLAFVSLSEKAWKFVEQAKRGYYFDLRAYRESLARKETPFTPAMPLFYALDEALLMIKEEGLEARFKRHSTCAEAVYRAVEAMGLEVYPQRDSRSPTVIAVKMPDGVSNEKLQEIMRKRYRVVISGGIGKLRGSIVRIGVMGAVSESDITITVTALENALAELGHKFDHGAGIKAARDMFSRVS